jgi:hypothetical protein
MRWRRVGRHFERQNIGRDLEKYSAVKYVLFQRTEVDVNSTPTGIPHAKPAFSIISLSKRTPYVPPGREKSLAIWIK